MPYCRTPVCGNRDNLAYILVTPSDLHVKGFSRFNLVVNLQFPFKFSKLLRYFEDNKK